MSDTFQVPCAVTYTPYLNSKETCMGNAVTVPFRRGDPGSERPGHFPRHFSPAGLLLREGAEGRVPRQQEVVERRGKQRCIYKLRADSHSRVRPKGVVSTE